MRRGLLTVTVGVVVSTAAAAAQMPFHVSGTVRDARTGAPVPHVIIRTSSGRTIRSTADGRFAMTLSTPIDTLLVRALGYREMVRVVHANDQPLELSLDQVPVVLHDVVVTGVRRAQRASEITTSLQVIDSAEIAQSGAPRINDVLAQQPALQADPGIPTGENIMIRGIGDARVLILVDGEPAAGALIENRDLSRLSTLAVQRIEVVKGPMSVMYGSDALGGVINIITTDAPSGLHQELESRVGDNGRAEVDGSVSGGGRIRYRVAGGVRRQEWTPGVADTDGTLARLWDLRTTVRAAVTDRVAVRADLNYVRERQRWPVSTAFNGFNDNWGITSWAELGTTGTTGVWTIRGFYQEYEHLFRQSRDAIPIADPTAPVQRERFGKGRIQWSKPMGNHQLDAGIEAGKRSIESPDKILDDRASDTQVELYGQDTWTWGRVVGTLGGRLTDNDQWGRAVTPSLGIAWLPTDQVRVRATVGRGFRGPSFKERAWNFANPQAGYTVMGNPDLDPESSWHGSLELSWSPDGVWRFTGETYRNDIDNLIEQSFVGSTPAGLLIFSPRNVSKARTQGVEVGGSWTGSVVEVAADYAYLDARDLELDLPLNRRAAHRARVRGTTRWPVGPSLLTVTTSAQYTGEAPLVGTDASSSPAIEGFQGKLFACDARADLAFLDGSLELEVGLDNAFNTRPAGWPTVLQRRVYVGLSARR
jgi:outer membrane receptor for ferrienterochelin and colicins